MSKEYTSDDIQILTDREHVRLRTALYLGNTSPVTTQIPNFIDGFSINEVTYVPATYKAVGEIIDNACDELTQIDKKEKNVSITVNDGVYTIADNGRGIPIDKHSSGKYTPEVALSSLRAGRNFGDDVQVGVIGQNGVGSAVTCFCSTQFDVLINRDGMKYTQHFADGALVTEQPEITKGTKTKTGTSVSFKLDPLVFKHGTDIPETMMHSRAIELAFNNPGFHVQYQKHSYQFPGGLEDIVKTISKDYFKFEAENMQFFVIFDRPCGIDEKMFTWVNSSLLFDGGICNTQFVNALCDKVCTSLSPRAKKLKCEVTKNDVRQDLLILASLKIEKPEYDAQSKTRLTGPNLRKPINDMCDDKWRSFSRAKKEWLELILERAAQRHKTVSDKNAIKQLTQPSKKKIPGLIDATSKYRSECILTVTEGLSASSMISEVRNPELIATYPLTGKINNVYGCSAGDILKMTKIIHLIQAIGLVPGQRAVRKNLNYGEIWISTDADHDGDDICALLVNMFFQFWPELFDPTMKPFIKRLVAPNVVVYKGDKRIHFSNRSDYEAVKDKYKNWSVDYYKGLGSMMECDWNIILYDNRFQIPITDDGKLKEVLSLLFDDKRADERKDWLQ